MQSTLPASAVPVPRAKSGISGGLQLAGLLGCLIALGWGSSHLQSFVRADTNNGVAQDGAAWEGRRLLAQYLWLKTHAVLHAGVEERDAKPGEEKTRANEFHTHGGSGHNEPNLAGAHDEHGDEHEDEQKHGDHDHDGHVFVIPPKREDFRGILGDLERAVQPYTDKKGKLYSKDSRQTIPFYRMMTWADPHYIQGYTVGATFIGKVGGDEDAGLNFLLEGERYNPDSFEIQTELGHFYLVYKQNYAAAEQHLIKALALVKGRKHLTEIEDDARTDAFRWLALTYQKEGKAEDAVRIAHQGLATLTTDVTMRHVLERHGRE